MREPQIALHLETGLMHQPGDRIRELVIGADLGNLRPEQRLRPTHPTRSAIVEACIVGVAASNARAACANASKLDPLPAR